jgi:hypothetical protein
VGRIGVQEPIRRVDLDFMGVFIFTIVISGLGSLVLGAAIVGRVSQQCRRAVDHAAVARQADQLLDARRMQPAGMPVNSGFRGDPIAISRESAG